MSVLGSPDFRMYRSPKMLNFYRNKLDVMSKESIFEEKNNETIPVIIKPKAYWIKRKINSIYMTFLTKIMKMPICATVN